MNEGQELVEAKSTEIKPFDQYEAEIVAFEKDNAEKGFDLTDPEGRKACEAHMLLIRKVEIRIEKTRKEKGKDLLKATKDLNASAKVFHERVHKMYEVWEKPIQVLKQIELDAMMDARDAEIAAEKAIQDEKDAELEKLRGIVAKQEADAKEKEDAAQATRDAAERKDELEAAALLAAENAKLQAKQDAIDAAAKAKRDQADAVKEVERKAKADAAILAKEIADKYEAEQAEQRKIDAGILARQKDVKHRQQFNRAAANSLDPTTGDSDISVAIIIAIVSGMVPNVTMNY
jgi:hypothetical protein